MQIKHLVQSPACVKASKILALFATYTKKQILIKIYNKPRQHIKMQRQICLLTKVCILKVMVFPVVMYGCESWTIKKAEHGRIDAF